MRILSAFALVFLFGVNIAFAQSEASKPIVSRPVYFDVSPPLRDMVKMNNDKVDMTWKDGVVKNNFYHGRNQEKLDPTFVDPIAQTFFGTTNTDTTIANFDGVGANSGVVPPDTDGDVGPDHYFATVNLKYAIYSKTGALLLGPANNSSVWTGMPNNSNDGDPIVLYDEQADRWLFTQFSLPNYPNGPFYMMIAVSQTPDPTGSWYRYQYSFTDMPDYPKFGVWPDGYYMSCNRFGSGSGNYVGTGVVAYNRDAMLAGNATAANIMFTLPASNSAWRFLPADCDSEFPAVGTPEYFAFLKPGSPEKVTIYKFTTDWATPSNSLFGLSENVDLTDLYGSISGGIPQKGTTVKLEPFSGTLMNRLPFRKFTDHWSMAACLTVNVGSNQAGIRWVELRKAVVTDPWTKYQEGTFSPDGNCRWMGSIAMDADNNIALGYSISSTDMYPSIRYTGRLAGDPLGVMSIAESGIINGGGSQTNTWSGNPSRWGDYSQMVCDPASPNTFWYTQEYYQTTSQSNWKTRIASFSFANLMTVTTTATPATICLGSSSQLSAEAAGGSGTFTYSWTSDPAGFTSTLQNPLVSPIVSTRYYVDVNDGTTTITDSVDVTVNELPTVFAGNDTTVCGWTANFPVEGSGSFLGLLQWTTSGDGTFDNATTAATNYNPSYNDKVSGSVTLTLTAEALAPCTGLASDDLQVVFDPCTGIPDPATVKLGMQISPNPTTGIFMLTLNNANKEPVTLTVTDVTGRAVLERTIETDRKVLKETVDLGKQPNGIYLVKLKSDHESATEKVVVN